MYAVDNSPIKQFFDIESPILKQVGRAYVFESFGFDEKPIVIKCRKMGADGQNHEAVYAEVGHVKSVEVVKQITIPGQGKAKDTIEEHDAEEFQVHFRSFNHTQSFDGDEVELEKVCEFACDMSLAAFGEEFNYFVDLEHQPKPGLNQTRDVLVKYGLVDEKSLPPKRVQKTQTHGGRGRNALSTAEAEAMTGARFGAV